MSLYIDPETKEVRNVVPVPSWSNIPYANSDNSQDVASADPYAALGSAKLAADYENKLFLENDSTKYQRAYKDILATGLNPRLLLGKADTNVGSSAVNYSESKNTSTSYGNSKSFSSSSVIVALIAALAGIAKAAI